MASVSTISKGCPFAVSWARACSLVTTASSFPDFWGDPLLAADTCQLPQRRRDSIPVLQGKLARRVRGSG
jgi:hypothetical protein